MKHLTLLKMIVVVIFLLAFSAQVFATPSVSVTKDYPVLWVNGPAAQSAPIIATVTDGGSSIAGVTVNFSTTLGSVSPSSAQTGSDGKATTTLTTGGSGGTATITATVTINQQQYSGNTTVKFTLGTWNVAEWDSQGSGSVSFTATAGSCYAEVNGEEIVTSGQQVDISDTYVNVYADMSGTSVQANGSGQTQVQLRLEWAGNVNNTVNPCPSRVKIKVTYISRRPISSSVGTPGYQPSGTVRSQSQTQGPDQGTPDTHSIILTVGSPPPAESGTEGPDTHIRFNDYKAPTDGAVEDSFNIYASMAPYITTASYQIIG